MKTERLSKTNLEVSKIGLGGIPLTCPTEDEVVKVVQRCLDSGLILSIQPLAMEPVKSISARQLVGGGESR